MAISLVHADNHTSNTGTTVVLPLPSGTTTGDVMFALLDSSNAGSVASMPAGWALVGFIFAGGSGSHYLYYKVATGSEPSTYTWTYSGSNTQKGGSIASYRGINPNFPFYSCSSTVYNTNDTNLQAATINTFEAGSVLLFFGSVSANVTFTAPTVPDSNWVQDFTVSNSGTCSRVIYRDTAPSIGATGNIVATLSGAQTLKHAFAICLNELNIGRYSLLRPATPTDDTGSGGTTTWTNPGNAITSNNSYATILSFRTDSHYLKAVNAGFAIPSTATIIGVSIEVECKNSSGTSQLLNLNKLYKAGTIQGSFVLSPVGSLSTTEGILIIGSVCEMWGSSLSPSDVNNSGFGIGIRHNNAAAITLSIDDILIRVCYVIPETEVTCTAKISIASSGATTDQTILGKARIEKSTAQTVLGKARVTVSTLKTILGVSRIQKSVTKTVTGLARVTASTINTILGKARISATTLKTITGKSRIEKSVLQTLLGKARVSVATSKTLLGKSRIGVTVSKTLTGLSRITATTAKTILGKARVTISNARTLLGKSRIQKSAISTIQGLAKISKTAIKTVLGIARITAITPKILLGRSRIANVTLKNITGLGDIAKSASQIILGKSAIRLLSTKTITGRSKIIHGPWYQKNASNWYSQLLLDWYGPNASEWNTKRDVAWYILNSTDWYTTDSA